MQSRFCCQQVAGARRQLTIRLLIESCVTAPCAGGLSQHHISAQRRLPNQPGVGKVIAVRTDARIFGRQPMIHPTLDQPRLKLSFISSSDGWTDPNTSPYRARSARPSKGNCLR